MLEKDDGGGRAGGWVVTTMRLRLLRRGCEERADTSRLASVETPLARGAVWLAWRYARNPRATVGDALFVSSHRRYVDRSFLGWHQSEAPRKAHGGFRREARGEGTHRLFCCCFDIRPLTDARRADGGAVPLIPALTLRTALRT